MKDKKFSNGITEKFAGIGFLIVALALLLPTFNLTDTSALGIYKWIYAAGALTYTVARVVGISAKGHTPRVRRLMRMEFWAGACFIVGAAFWFYNEARFGIYGGTLAIIRPTVVFSLAGAVLQLVASVLISRHFRAGD